MKYKMFLASILILIVAVTSGCSITVKDKKENTIEQNPQLKETEQLKSHIEPESITTEFQEKIIGNDLPVSRALAAKMITLAMNHKWELAALDKEILFTDVKEEDWYYDYINGVVAQGYMSGTGEEFLPLEPLTIEQAQLLIDRINTSNKTKIKMTDENRTKPISYSLWVELFEKALKAKGGEETLAQVYGIEEKKITVFGTPGNCNLAPWTMATDKGLLGFSGFSVDAYIDHTIKVLIKDGEMLSAVSIMTDSPTITSVYFKVKSPQLITVIVGGGERDLLYLGAEFQADGSCIADITLKNGQIVQIQPLAEKITGTVKKVNSSCIELEKEGEKEFLQDGKIYEEEQEAVYWRALRNLICGTDIADYYLKDGKIAAAVIRRTVEPNKIRVVISNDNGEYVQNTIALYADSGFIVSNGEMQKESNSMEISLDKEEELFESGNRITVTPKAENGKIQIKSILKNDSVPEYRGVLEIEKREDGFVIVNELGIEPYLYAVVPSEMPSSYGIEASKVQAITARSYAYNQFYGNKFHEYGANVDDSTTCQVYNNAPENETSIAAVDATKGICITYKDSVISANFFSTSAGTTANSGDVWANGADKSFPSATEAYLKSKPQYQSGEFGDLSQEENAYQFFKNTKIDSYDNWTGWFRWNVFMTGQQLTEIVNHTIKQVYESNKALVKTMQKDGTYKSRPIETVGQIQDIIVKKRGQGGNVMELVIKGTKAQVMIMTEYNIRKILQPVNYVPGADDIILTCMDGTKKINYKLLPSGFFTFDTEKGDNQELSAITIYGGGNGHGVGLSQNGTKGMVEKGMSYEEILKHYYEGTQLSQVLE